MKFLPPANSRLLKPNKLHVAEVEKKTKCCLALFCKFWFWYLANRKSKVCLGVHLITDHKFSVPKIQKFLKRQHWHFWDGSQVCKNSSSKWTTIRILTATMTIFNNMAALHSSCDILTEQTDLWMLVHFGMRFHPSEVLTEQLTLVNFDFYGGGSHCRFAGCKDAIYIFCTHSVVEKASSHNLGVK